LLLVNKADGDFVAAARRAVADYRNALRLLRPPSAVWTPEVAAISALTHKNIDRVWATVGRYRTAMTAAGRIAERRAEQARAALWAEIGEALTERLRDSPRIAEQLPAIEAAVMKGDEAPSLAARRLLAAFLDGSS